MDGAVSAADLPSTPRVALQLAEKWRLDKYLDVDPELAKRSDRRVPTQKAVKDYVDSRQAFPVGSVFTSILPANPGDTLGYGTWVAHGAGRVLIGVDPLDGDFDAAGKTGGTKTITIPDHANHTHQVDCNVTPGMVAVNATAPTLPVVNSISPLSVISYGASVPLAHVDSVTGLPAIHTLPPYISVYFWVRTA